MTKELRKLAEAATRTTSMRVNAAYCTAAGPEEILALLDRLEKAEKDAARLDWLNSQGYAYGFQDMHEGNRWTIDGPFANVRIAIDSAMEASK